MSTFVDVATPHGPARWHVDVAHGRRRLLLALGHGAGGGVEAPDLVVLAQGLPPLGVTVARFEQPWRVAGRRVASLPPQLDTAWVAAAEPLVAQAPGVPLVVGGRSAGARVACRTAAALSAAAVLTLAFPLHPPGRPERSRQAELVGDRPLLVVQGARDAFGSPDDVQAVLPPRRAELVALVGADHSLRVTRSGPLTQQEADEILLLSVARWLARLVPTPARGNLPHPVGC